MPETKAKTISKSKKTKETKSAINPTYKDIISKIEKLTVLELTEFVSALEEKFGKVEQVAVAQSAGNQANNAQADEKTEFDIELVDAGANKLTMIKTVKEITQKGLIEAKTMTESVPVVIKEKVKKEEAEEIRKKIEEAGGKAELK